MASREQHGAAARSARDEHATAAMAADLAQARPAMLKAIDYAQSTWQGGVGCHAVDELHTLLLDHDLRSSPRFTSSFPRRAPPCEVRCLPSKLSSLIFDMHV